MLKNRITYLLLFLLSFIFVYFFGGKIPYMIFYLVITLPIVSFLYVLFVYYRFKYVQEIDKNIILKGDKITIKFMVANEDYLLYPYIKVAFACVESTLTKELETVEFSLLPLKRKDFSFECDCSYRGTFEIGVKYIEFEDFLGIFKLVYKNKKPNKITVYPEIIPIEQFKLNTDYMSESQSMLSSRYDDLSTIVGFNAYSYGDSLKKIHWKLTAKTGELVVKKYQSTSETSTIIVLDLETNPYSYEQNIVIEDRVIESALAVIHYCLNKWIPIKLLYYDNGEIKITDAKNALSFDDIYASLASIGFNQEMPVSDILEAYLSDSVFKTNIILVTSNLNYDLYNQIHKALSSGYEVEVVYISPEEVTGVADSDANSIFDFLPELGVNAYKLDIGSSIQEVLER